jgi:DNA-binding transcriptional LysR family regulator
MDFKQIVAFISVAKSKSFSKAASIIFLSQPTISSHISKLEKELSVQLFDRTSKEVMLTAAGESFLEYALAIINTRNAAVSHVSSFNETISGKLNLTASTTPCNSIVPTLIKKFNLLYPKVHYSILQQNSGDIIENIIRFNCEIGIVGSYVSDDKIKCYKLIEDELILISNPALEVPDEISINSILNYKFIMREINSATRKTLENMLLEYGFDSKLNVLCEVNNLDVLIQLVKAALGVSIVSKAVCKDTLKLGEIKTSTFTDFSLKRNMYLVVSSKRTLTPTASAFFNFCKDYFNFEQ